MRKIILFAVTSVDGYIAREDGAVDWLFTDQDYGYREFIEQVDTLLMGRTTYEQVLTFGEWPYVGKDCIVFSSRPGEPTEHAKFTSESPKDVIAGLRARPGKDLWLVGGGKLVASFLNEKLVDEVCQYIQPTMLGSGIPLYPPSFPRQDLILIDTEQYSSGMVRIRYKATSTT